MEFVNISFEVLRKLKEQGYNILASNNDLYDEEVIWYPEKVDNVFEYLIGLDINGESNLEPNLLVIDDALLNINEQELRGIVLF